jgi:hypothetical protein
VRYDDAKTREDRLKNVPTELDKMADAALNYRPKRKANKPKARKRRKAK